MKNLILVLFLSLYSFSFSQKIIVEVQEKQKMSSPEKVTLDEILNDPYVIFYPEPCDKKVVIDLSDSIVEVYENGKFIGSDSITYIENSNSIYTIQIKDNAALVLNLEEGNESALIYVYDSLANGTRVSKYTKFYFVKQS